MSDPTIDDAPLKRQLLELDILLRRKQSFWETPRAILLIVATSIAAAGLVFGLLGYKIGSTTQQITVHLDQPLIVQPTPHGDK